jgi:soluble lytic murein transglycosylase
VASATLRPMAQQLIANRTPVAYAAVEKYANANTGEPASLAWLAAGFAHGLDQDCKDAVVDYAKAKKISTTLGDYLDFYAAQCYQQMQQSDRVRVLLTDFDKHYPDSSLIRSSTILLADAYLALGDAKQAITIYESNRDPIRADLELALAHAYTRTGDLAKANAILQHLYLALPLTDQASIAAGELQKNHAMPSAADLRKTRADLLQSGKHYPEAVDEYRALLAESSAH